MDLPNSFDVQMLFLVIAQSLACLGVVAVLVRLVLKGKGSRRFLVYSYELLLLAIYASYLVSWPVEVGSSLGSRVYWAFLAGSSALALAPLVEWKRARAVGSQDGGGEANVETATRHRKVWALVLLALCVGQLVGADLMLSSWRNVYAAASDRAPGPAVRMRYLRTFAGKSVYDYVRLTLVNQQDRPVWFLLPYPAWQPMPEDGVFRGGRPDEWPFSAKAFVGNGGSAIEVEYSYQFKAFHLPPGGRLEVADYEIGVNGYREDTRNKVVVLEAQELKVDGKVPLDQWLPYKTLCAKEVRATERVRFESNELNHQSEKVECVKVEFVKAEGCRRWPVRFRASSVGLLVLPAALLLAAAVGLVLWLTGRRKSSAPGEQAGGQLACRRKRVWIGVLVGCGLAAVVTVLVFPSRIKARCSTYDTAGAANLRAYANTATPLMWVATFHLLIGNALIGIGEGLLVAWLFKARVWRTVLLMIAANYLSMLAGVLAVDLLAKGPGQWLMGDQPLYSARLVLALVLPLLFLASYVFTVFAEWPFCAFALWADRERRWKRGLRASVVAQTASYAVLVPIYLLGSQFSLYTAVKADRGLVSATANDAVIYYLSPGDNTLRRIDVNGTEGREVGKVAPGSSLVTLRESENSSSLDLCTATMHSEKAAGKVLVPQIAVRPANAGPEEYDAPLWARLGKSMDVRPEDQRRWKVRSWAPWGLLAENASTGERLTLAFETPLMTWNPGSATVLEGDRVVYQLGGQIVLLDLKRKKIGLICLGRSPVVIPKAWLKKAPGEGTQ